MKDFIFKLSKFILGFSLLTGIPILFISQYDNLDKLTSQNHNIISLQTKSLYDSLDILFVGNSYFYSSINTNYLDSLNVSSFNLGIATAGVEFYDLLLVDYFNNIDIEPKKTVLLITPMTFSSKSDNFISYPIHRYLENELSNLDIVFRYNKFDDLFLMYKESTFKAYKNITNKLPKLSNTKRYNNKGFKKSYEVFNENKISKTGHLYLQFKTDVFDLSKVDKLLQIAKGLKQKNTEVIFLELPTNILNKYFNTNYILGYQKAVDKIKKSFTFISIESKLFSKSNYRNIDHMNVSGATIATKEIVRLLELKQKE